MGCDGRTVFDQRAAVGVTQSVTETSTAKNKSFRQGAVDNDYRNITVT